MEEAYVKEKSSWGQVHRAKSHPQNYITESKLQMLSPDGRSRMWDADANRYARGEGVAAVVLKSPQRRRSGRGHH